MAKRTTETTETKTDDHKIVIDKDDLPKKRDWNRVALIGRKKGAHKSVKKEADKNKCRQKVGKDDV